MTPCLLSDEQITPASGLVSILKKRVNTDTVDTPNRSEPEPKKGFAQRRVRFKVPDDSYDSGMCLCLMSSNLRKVPHYAADVHMYFFF